MMPSLPSPLVDRAVAATPPNPALEDASLRQPTALSEVFRRLAPEAPPIPAARLEMLGFDEPGQAAPRVGISIPPVEEFAQLVGETQAEFRRGEGRVVEANETPSHDHPEPQRQPTREAASSALEMPASAVWRTTETLYPAVASGGAPAIDRESRPSRGNRRLDRRAKLPAEMEIGGVPCTLIDVSVGGFAATGVPAIEPDAVVPVTIRLVIDGIEVGTQLTARIVYVTPARSSGRFVELTPSQIAFLRYIVTWRGEAAGVVGTTTLLDAIAGGAERATPPGVVDRLDPAPRDRWWLGRIGRRVSPPR